MELGELKKFIKDKALADELVFRGREGLTIVKVSDFLEQDIREILHDLGYDKASILSHATEDGYDWVNEYATVVLLEYLSRWVITKSGFKKVIEMQEQIDDDYRFKDYLLQILAGYKVRPLVFKDKLNSYIFDQIEELVNNRGAVCESR